MAARLNKPTDFTARIHSDDTSRNNGKKPSIQLLPPSMFEKTPGGDDPWRELAKATGEIVHLKTENSRLKEARHVSFPTGEEIKARVDIHHTSNQPALPPTRVSTPHTPNHDLSHYSEIINRQAADLTDLRKEMAITQAEHHKALARLESAKILSDTQLERERAALQEQVQTLKEHHAEEITARADAYKERLAQQAAIITGLRDDLTSLSQAKDTQETQLNSLVSDLQQELESTKKSFEKNSSEKDQLIEEQKHQLSQFKLYITETEDSYKSNDVWKRDVENLKNELQKYEKERQNLESTVQLMNIRLNSQNKIMALQEQDLSKGKEDQASKKRNNLLTRWREKVYELMLQLKCEELAHRDEISLAKQKGADLLSMLEHSERQCKVLQHKVEDKDAELDMAHNNIKILQGELEQAQNLVLELDDKITGDRNTGTTLAEYAHGVYNKYGEVQDLFENVMSTLLKYNQRITFASGRIHMLQGQFARKEAVMKMHLESRIGEKPTHDFDEKKQLGSFDTELEMHLNAELVQVTKERDTLVKQVKEDAQLLESKVQASKQQVADQVANLEQRIEDLCAEIENKNQKCQSLTENLYKTQEDLSEAQETIESLKSDISKQQMDTLKELECLRAEEEAKFVEQLAEMEKRLNDARREHTKAVISMRQIERQGEREKQREAERSREEKETYQAHVTKLQARLHSVEKDRNLLMATLKQEGLVGKYKSQRPPAAIFGNDDEEEDEMEPVKDDRTDSAPGGEKMQDEPLHSVLDDLRSLTATVMEDTTAIDTPP